MRGARAELPAAAAILEQPAGAATGEPSTFDDVSDEREATPWADLPSRLRARGLRWTPQRRTLLEVLEVLAGTTGHVTGVELIERCRALDPTTIPSTVYRTLDVLEDLGIVRHAHGVDGREEFHVLPAIEHGHLHCTGCQGAWEIGPDEARTLVAAIEGSRGFRVDLSHLSVAGLCADCATSSPEVGP
ncbi:MAG: Fur family transcriptional regulator [Candidatus Limnocylindrales bacterium]